MTAPALKVQRGLAVGTIDNPPTLQKKRPASDKNRRILLNAFEMAAPGHLSPGSWTGPGDTTLEVASIKYWTDLAKTLERGKFNGLFVADVLGLYDIFEQSGDAALEGGVQTHIIDPLLTVSAMAAVTTNLTFGITHSVTYEAPYTVARRYATLDHLTEGRAGFNIVTSHFISAALNMGHKEMIEHDERYIRADEYTDVLYKLWESSWRDDAVVADKEKGVYADPARVRKIHHNGKYFSCEGPSGVAPSAQRTPLLYQAGGSPAGLRYAAKHAEAVFVGGTQPAKIRASADILRALAEENGRDPYSIKIILGVTVIVDSTDELARAKEAELRKYASNRGAEVLIGGWTGVDLAQFGPDDDLLQVAPPHFKGIVSDLAKRFPDVPKWTREAVTNEVKIGGLNHLTITGSPTTVADRLQQLVDEGDIDGFNFAYATSPGTFVDIVDHLVPELQRRGVHWTEYPAGADGKPLTAREAIYGAGQKHLRDDHYGSRFSWNKGEEPPALD